MKPKICWILCGGTIFMKPSASGQFSYLNGGELEKEKLLNRFERLQEFVDIGIDDIKNLGAISEIDSSNIVPSNWVTIAKEAAAALNSYDGVLITHGTDTMHYTSAALSFMIKNSSKTIAITGSQIAASEPNTDADKNLYDAVKVAASSNYGVCIVFASKIIRGTRAKKTSSVEFDAFESFCSPLLGKTGEIQVQMKSCGNMIPRKRITSDSKLDTRVGHIKVFPGINPRIIKWYVEKEYKGIVIEGFGSGHANVDSEQYSFLPYIKDAKKNGVPVFICTQCNRGTVDLRLYDVGKKLKEAGAVGLGDMLPEVAVIKLMHVLAHHKNLNDIEDAMVKNLAAEINF
jgi:L-asparaginase type I